MGDSRVQDAMSEQARMESGRSNFNNLWQEVADRVDPIAGQFTTQVTPGTQRVEKMFDSTATIALGKATASYESLSTPRTQKWHNLVPSDEHLREDQEVKVYLERFRDLLFQVRYSSRANFASQNSEDTRQFLNYGNGVLYVDDDPGVSLRYKMIAMAESFFAEDHNGRVDRFHRKFKLTVRQLMQKFPKGLPDKIVALADKEPNLEFDVLHRLCPNYDRNPRRMDYAGAPVLGSYLLPAEQSVIDVAGFRSLPYLVSRYRVNAREVYGRGPVMDVLATIKTVNEMKKTNLRVGQRSADPPLLAYRDGMTPQFNMRGGYVNYGTMDQQGNPLIRPLETGGNLPVALEMMEREQQDIKDALFIEIFQALRDNPQMTATQTLQLVQERGVLMSPSVGNRQSMYGQMIEREIELLSAVAGGRWLESKIGPMPDALREAGGNFEIEYDAPINKAQRAEEGIAILQTMNDAIPFADIDPGVMKIFKVKESLRRVAEIRGFPATLLATDDEIEQQDAEDANQQQIASLLAAAPVVTDSVKSLAQANAVAGTSPQQLPAGLAA